VAFSKRQLALLLVGEVVQRAEQQRRVDAPCAHREASGIAVLGGHPIKRRRRLDVVRNRVDQMDVVPVLSNPAGMGARAAANVKNSRRRRWEIATD
jgi:hypothetical protein